MDKNMKTGVMPEDPWKPPELSGLHHTNTSVSSQNTGCIKTTVSHCAGI